jgi:hypothetical protein
MQLFNWCRPPRRRSRERAWAVGPMKGARRWYVAGAAAAAVAALGGAPAMAGVAPTVPSAAAVDFVHACPPGSSGEVGCMALRRTNVHAARVALADPSPSGLNPADLAAAYQLNTSGGGGQTVAIVDAYDDANAESDLATYRAQFGLPACTSASGCFHKVNQAGADSPLPPPSPAGLDWGFETSLDLDMVSAVCPNCHILLVEANSQDKPDLYAGVDAAAASASFVSDSWGYPEYQGETNDDVHFNHPGKVIAFATGDSGHDGGVSYPAASQYVVAVGGTSLTRGTSGNFTEQAWSGAGSGCSAYEPQLGWQVGPPDTQCANRAVADVSAVADPNTGVSVYDTIDDTGWDVAGGTSVATPIITAVYALAGPPPPASDPASFYLYRHFIGRGPSVVPAEHVLNDITTGSNGDCGAPTCDARIGWDGPTGVGTPVGTGAFVRPFAFGAIVTGDQATLAGTPVSLTVSGRDGTLPYTWSASGLPPNLSINSSTGVISGTPTAVGTYSVTITGHDATASPPGSYTFHWVINPPSMATVPNLIDDGRSQVASDLSDAGLVVGSQGTAVDCNHLGTVRSQNPQPGTQVARGSAVSVVYGTTPKPPKECP